MLPAEESVRIEKEKSDDTSNTRGYKTFLHFYHTIYTMCFLGIIAVIVFFNYYMLGEIFGHGGSAAVSIYKTLFELAVLIILLFWIE